jgi:hypothetical protein
MTNNELWTVLCVAVVIVLGLMVWLAIFASKVAMVFTMFVQLKLHPMLSVLIFVIFPPSFFVFIVGLALIHFGYAEKAFGKKDELKHQID